MFNLLIVSYCCVSGRAWALFARLSSPSGVILFFSVLLSMKHTIHTILYMHYMIYMLRFPNNSRMHGVSLRSRPGPLSSRCSPLSVSGQLLLKGIHLSTDHYARLVSMLCAIGRNAKQKNADSAYFLSGILCAPLIQLPKPAHANRFHWTLFFFFSSLPISENRTETYGKSQTI